MYDGESVDSSPVLATWDGPAHPGKDDGTIEAQSKRSGGVLTVKVEAAGSCPTFGLMFDYNIHPPKDEEDEKSEPEEKSEAEEEEADEAENAGEEEPEEEEDQEEAEGEEEDEEDDY